MDQITYDFDIQNHLEYPIKLVPVSLEDTSKFELPGEVIIQPTNIERKFPKINLGKDTVSIDPMK